MRRIVTDNQRQWARLRRQWDDMDDGSGQQAVGVDLGSDHARCVVAVWRNGKLEYRAHADLPSRGWGKSEIVDRDEVRRTKSALLDAGGCEEDSVIVYGFWSPRVRTIRDVQFLEFPDGRPLNEKETLGLSSLFWKKRNHLPRRAYGFVTLYDDMHTTEEVISTDDIFFKGAEIIEVLAYTAREETVKEFDSTVITRGWESWEYELRAATVAVCRGSKDEGSTLVIDIGADSSGGAIWECDEVRWLGGLWQGVKHITRDIAFDLGMRPREDLQIVEGTLAVEREHVRVAAFQFADYIRSELLDESVLSSHAVNKIVLTGGGALISGVREAIEVALGVSTSVGYPSGIRGAPRPLLGPEWCVAYGLALIAGDEIHR